MSFYVKKSNEIVGEAIVLKNAIHVHLYDSRGSITWSVGQIPKRYKLIAKEPNV